MDHVRCQSGSQLGRSSMGPLFSLLLTQQQHIPISLRWLAHPLAKAGTCAQSSTSMFTHCLLESTSVADTRKPASDPSNNVGQCSIGRQHLPGTQLPGPRLSVEGPLDRWSPDYYVLGHSPLKRAGVRILYSGPTLNSYLIHL